MVYVLLKMNSNKTSNFCCELLVYSGCRIPEFYTARSFRRSSIQCYAYLCYVYFWLDDFRNVSKERMKIWLIGLNKVERYACYSTGRLCVRYTKPYATSNSGYIIAVYSPLFPSLLSNCYKTLFSHQSFQFQSIK